MTFDDLEGRYVLLRLNGALLLISFRCNENHRPWMTFKVSDN